MMTILNLVHRAADRVLRHLGACARRSVSCAVVLLVSFSAFAHMPTLYGALNAKAMDETWPGDPILNQNISNVVRGLSYSHSQDYHLDTTTDDSPWLWNHYDHDQSQVISNLIAGDRYYSITAHAQVENSNGGYVSIFRIDSQNVDPQTEFMRANPTAAMVNRIYLSGSGFITEHHPSSVKWMPRYDGTGRITSSGGYIFVAEEYEQHAVLVIPWNQTQEQTNQVRSIPLNSQLIFPNDPTLGVSNVWLFRKDGFVYVVSVDNNRKIGEVRRAPPGELFSYFGTTGNRQPQDFNAQALRYVGTFMGCSGQYFGANSVLVQDVTGEWYVLREYGTRDSVEITGNYVEANHVTISDGNIICDCVKGVVAKQSFPVLALGACGGLYPAEYCAPNGEGAAGFRVTSHGDLTLLLGAHYSAISGFNYTSWEREVRAK